MARLDHRLCHHCGFSSEQDPTTKVWTCERLSCERSWTLGAPWQHFCTTCHKYIDIAHGCGCLMEGGIYVPKDSGNPTHQREV